MLVSVGKLTSPAILRAYFQKRQLVFKLPAVPSVAIQRLGARGKELISLLLNAARMTRVLLPPQSPEIGGCLPFHQLHSFAIAVLPPLTSNCLPVTFLDRQAFPRP